MTMQGLPRPAAPVIALIGVVVVALVLATELWVWLNLWPLSVGWWTAVVWSLPQLYVWLLMTPVIVLVLRRWPIRVPVRASVIALHLGAGVLFSLAALMVLDLSNRVIHWTTWMAAPATLVAEFRYTIIHLHFGIAMYWVLVGSLNARYFYRQFRERDLAATQLEGQLARAQLERLQAQLQPHFLFNTLNSIGVLIKRDPEAAQRTLQQLSDLLRAVLDGGVDASLPLTEELEFVERYLDIEQTRFEDRLTVSYDIDPDTLSIEVPAFLLQPLVENAIKHAIAPHATPGTITITSRTVAHGTELIVRDTGPGILDTAVSRNGVGLANTRDRLETLYGRSDLLQLESIPGQGFTARVLIPDEPRTASTIPPRDADASHAHR